MTVWDRQDGANAALKSHTAVQILLHTLTVVIGRLL